MPPPRKKQRTGDAGRSSLTVGLVDDWRDALSNKNGRIYLMLDFGTSKHGAHYALDMTGAAEPLDVSVEQLSLDPKNLLQTALLGFEEDKTTLDNSGRRVFIARHGNEVQRLCSRGDIEPDNFFRNLKQSEPFINAHEMDDSKYADYLRGVQRKHANLLAKLRGSKIIMDHELTGVRETMILESMKDVVCLQMKLLRLDIINRLMMVSSAEFATIEEIFSGDANKPFGTKLLLGVSAPDIWHRQRLVLYEILIDAGFPPQLEILSEAKCSAAAVLRRRFDRIPRREGVKSADEIKKLASKIMVVVDRGGHTLDVSSMRLTEVATVDRKTSLKFRAVTDSVSTEDGGERVTDYFRRHVIEAFGSSYTSVTEHLSDENGENGDLILIEGLLNSIELEKINPKVRNRGDKVTLSFDHDKELPPGRNADIRWEGKKLILYKSTLRDSVVEAIQNIVDKDGPLLRQVRKTREIEPNAPIEIILSGGGSKDILLREMLKAVVGKSPHLRNVTFGTEDHNGQSLVSIGGIYLLVDPTIGDGNIIAERSYGMVYTATYNAQNPIHRSRSREKQPMQPHASAKGYKNRFELPNTVDWLTPMGSRVRTTSKKIEMSRQFELDKGQKPDPQRLIDVAFEIVSTNRADLGKRNGVNARQDGIEHTTEFAFDMKTKDLAKCARKLPQATHGFVQYRDPVTKKRLPEWKLEFDCEVIYRWAGMLQIFEVRMPYGGYFPEDKELSNREMCIRRFQIIGECQFRDDQEEQGAIEEELENDVSTDVMDID